MPWINTSTSRASPMTVSVPPWVVFVSHGQSNGDDEPTYNDFRYEPRLNVESIFYGSSFAGQSYAKLTLATGEPYARQIDVENGGQVLRFGDRVALGFPSGRGIAWRFAGYVTLVNLYIGDKGESLVFKVSGPEWKWGDAHGGNGANKVIEGQYRRNFDADDTFADNPTAEVTEFEDWDVYTDLLPIFNEGGHKNMTAQDVILVDPTTINGKEFKGRIWEIPERIINSTPCAEHWNISQAAKTVVARLNDYNSTSINIPVNWDALPLDTADIMRETDIDGLGLWAALLKICGPKFGFYVSPIPDDINGDQWGPFWLYFFSRTQGNLANLWLNFRGTPMSQAKASVRRIEAARDISKTTNRIITCGKLIRHVRLYYYGSATDSLIGDEAKTALQHGWSQDEFTLDAYATADHKVMDEVSTVEEGGPEDYLDMYVVGGSKFAGNEHILRRFIWNEANEWQGKTAMYGRDRPFDWFAPDLVGIADNDQDSETAGYYVRRRRKMGDCAFLSDEVRDGYLKVRPTLYMAAAKGENDANPNDWKWKRIAESHYTLDPQRCAFTFTVADLAAWRPLERHENDAITTIDDPRTFATLLYTGLLRMCLEGTIETDDGILAEAPRIDSSGSPFLVRQFIRAQQSFLQVLEYDDGHSSPSGMMVMDLDQSAEANNFATATRDYCHDQAIHASVSVSADWPMQSIGSMIQNTNGRYVDFTTSDGRGAQIVAIHIDPKAMEYEYLTESAAMRVRDADRSTLAERRMSNRLLGQRRATINP